MRPVRKENYWISLSDIMTGLMVIFMFIAISYILKVRKQQEAKDQIIENYKNTKIALLYELREEFEEDFAPTKWNAIIDEDLSIKFLNERVLFAYDRDNIRAEFKEILDNFFPRYLNILMKDKYKESIAEVRIEGHTDSSGDYMYNVNLSQRRTANVLDYLLNEGSTTLIDFSEENRALIRFWFTANGFSSGRTLDPSGEYTLKSGNHEDRQRSRRVEFRIVVKSDEIIQKVINQMENE